MNTYNANNSYIAIIPEVTAGTPLKATKFLPLVSEDLKTIVNHKADLRMKGIDWKSDDLIRGNRTHEGKVVLLGDPDTLGHVLNMIMKKGSSTGSVLVGYTHPFTVDTPKSYTFEIKRGLYTQRFFGVMINSLDLEFKDQQMQLTLNVKAQGQFSIGSVGVALTGAGMVSLVLDDTYDIAPNRGLVAGDVITVGGVDVTLLTVAVDGFTVTFATTAITASIGDPVILKPQTASMLTIHDPFYFGNAMVGMSPVNIAGAITLASSRSTAVSVSSLKITINNNLLAQAGTNRIDPSIIITGTKEAQVEIQQLFQDSKQRQAFLERRTQAISINFLGHYIKADFSTQELMTLNFNNVKLITDENAIKVGTFIIDDEKFEVLADASGVAMTASLVNNTAGTDY